MKSNQLTFKDMPQVSPALTADHLRPGNHQLVVRLQSDCRGRNRLIETRPARPAVVFGGGSKQGMPATGATKGSRIGLAILFDRDLVEDRGSRGFGSLLAQNVVLVGGQNLFPFVVGFFNRKAGAILGDSRWVIPRHEKSRSMSSCSSCKVVNSSKALHRNKHNAEKEQQRRCRLAPCDAHIVDYSLLYRILLVPS